MKRRVGVLLVGALALTLSAELGARWVLGLGDPPLTILDPEIEYLFAPNQDLRRFGNRVIYNDVSMRSADAWANVAKRPDELRILVLGDSVINGGALTDHERLATTIAQKALDHAKRPVRVGNASAGSWGPENWLAYVDRYGTFGADLVVVVASTHDLRDVRTFPEELGPDFPLAKPTSALGEGIGRYLLPRLGLAERPPPPATAPSDAVDRSVAALEELFRKVRETGAHLVVLHHPERDEPDRDLAHDALLLRAVVERSGHVVVPMSAWLGTVGRRNRYYSDEIHINEDGQKVYADILICLAENRGSAQSCARPRR